MSAGRTLYVAGFGRSGSTLVEGQLANRHEAVGLGEIFFVWQRGALRNERCSCGLPFLDCPFWRAVLETGFGRLTTADYARFDALFQSARGVRPRPGAMQRAGAIAAGEFGDVARRLYGAIHEILGEAVLLDSSKYPLFGAALAAAGATRIEPLHVYRDPRGVAASWQRVVARPESTGEQDHMARSRSVVTSAWRWLWFNRCARELCASLTPSLSLAYEDFCRAPERELDRIADRFSLPLRTSAIQTVQHSVSGNPLRFRPPSDIRLDEGWRDELSAAQQAIIMAMCGPYYAWVKNSPSAEH